MSADTVTTPREYLKSVLPPLLPDGWRLIPYQRIPATIDVVTVAVKHTELEPFAAAPIGSLGNTVVVTIVSPYQGHDAAEDELDDAVRLLCMRLDGLDRVLWDRAAKVAVADGKYLGWDIFTTIRTDLTETE